MARSTLYAVLVPWSTTHTKPSRSMLVPTGVPQPGSGIASSTSTSFSASTSDSRHGLLPAIQARPSRSIWIPRKRAPEVAALMAGPLGWDAGRIALEVQHYTARVAAERESQRMPDDRTADAARLGAPDVRAPAGAASLHGG